MYKVMIVGHGFVGSAIASLFSDEEKVIVDPKFTDNKISDNPGIPFDAVFVSVDTPKAEGFKLLDSVLQELDYNMVEGTPVCCKSTATPEFYYEVSQKYKNIKIVHSPEYLNKSNPIKMFQGQKFFIIGGDQHAAMTVGHIFKSRLNHVKNIRYTDIKTAAMVKYSENAFLAMRVTFFNEVYKMHKAQGCESTYEEFAEMVGLDERIGQSHSKVPGSDGKFGWDSHCFNKDLYELEIFGGSPLIKFIRELNAEHRSIES
jgi:UDP-glucose 6-dehydrogenase